MKIRLGFVPAFLLLLSTLPISHGEDALRTFTSPDGRTLKAVIKAYNPRNEKIRIELENGKDAWVQPMVFSEEDQAYIRQWIIADQFLSSGLFKIECDSTKERDTEYRYATNGRRSKSLEKTDLVYTITLHNRTEFPLEDIRIEYRAFIEKHGHDGMEDESRVDGGHLLIAEIPVGEEISIETEKMQLETVYGSSHERYPYIRISPYAPAKVYEDELKGFWIRAYGPAIDGQEVIREWCSPSDTMDIYEWQDVTTFGASNAVFSLPRDVVRAVADEYEDALKTRDEEALARLFQKSKWTDPGWMWDKFKNLDMSRIEGNNIYVEVDGQSQRVGWSGWIQLTPEGKIKYCPLLAPHPIEKALFPISKLIHDSGAKDHWIRALIETGIPTFGLQQDMNDREINDCLSYIREWIIFNGSSFDNSEPVIYLPEEQMVTVEYDLFRKTHNLKRP